MRFKRDAIEEADETKDQLQEETAKDQDDTTSTSIRNLNYKLKYFNILQIHKFSFIHNFAFE